MPCGGPINASCDDVAARDRTGVGMHDLGPARIEEPERAAAVAAVAAEVALRAALTCRTRSHGGTCPECVRACCRAQFGDAFPKALLSTSVATRSDSVKSRVLGCRQARGPLAVAYRTTHGLHHSWGSRGVGRALDLAAGQLTSMLRRQIAALHGRCGSLVTSLRCSCAAGARVLCQPEIFRLRGKGSKRRFDDLVGRFSGMSTFVRMSGVPLVARAFWNRASRAVPWHIPPRSGPTLRNRLGRSRPPDRG